VREGNDVYTTVGVTITQAALGATITVPTLDGEEGLELDAGTLVNIDIVPGAVATIG